MRADIGDAGNMPQECTNWCPEYIQYAGLLLALSVRNSTVPGIAKQTLLDHKHSPPYSVELGVMQ